jgi:hypothetical protein
MKKIAFTVLYLAATTASATGLDESLEPCMNGGVSATGDHVSQQQEDVYTQARELALEPCINGGVSANGNYASQAIENYEKPRLTYASR